MHSSWPILAAAALSLPTAVFADPLTIDDFDGAYGSQGVYYSSGPPVQSLLQSTVAAPVPGGTRRLQLVPDTAALGTATAGISGFGDLWAFSSGAQRLDFNWAYGTRSAMNLDLSGATSLRLDMYFSTPMKLVVYASTETLPGENPDASAVTIDLADLFRESVDIPLSSFRLNSGSGRAVNWADVDGLSFFVSYSGAMPASGDGFWVQRLSAVAVPEPASAALAAAALVLLGSQRARTRRHAQGKATGNDVA